MRSSWERGRPGFRWRLAEFESGPRRPAGVRRRARQAKRLVEEKKMRWLSFVPLMAAMGVGATLLAGAAPRAERPRYLLTDREGFVLREAELIAAPLVTAAVWSPDGRYLLAVRQEKLSPPLTEPVPSGALSLITWNRGTGRSRVIWQRPAGAQMISQIA